LADVKISGLPASTTPLAGTEVLPIVQGGQTRQVSVANLTAGRAVSATTVSASTSVTTPVIQATSSAGGTLKNNSGTAQLQWGSGGGSNLSLEVATNINPANAAVVISPTGTGTVTINPATASTMNNVAIGSSTPLAGAFTTVTATTIDGTTSIRTTKTFEYPALGSMDGAIKMLSTSGVYGLFGGVSSGGYSWLQTGRNDANATAYTLYLNNQGGDVNLASDKVIASSTGLAVTGNLSATGDATVTSGSSGTAIFQIGPSAPSVDGAGYIKLINSNSVKNWQISSNGVATVGSLEFTPSSAVGGTTFSTPAMTLNASGGLKTLNTIGVGNATPSASGAGITFPAVQSASTDANTLDDYEEGTFTPTQGAGLTVVGAFSSAGRYVKVGKIVSIYGYVGGATSVVYTTGTGPIFEALPFAADLTYDYQLGQAMNLAGTVAYVAFTYNLGVYGVTSIAGTFRILFSCTYQTA
jgi:hypothetical protein